MGSIIFITGGARSGKSRFAEMLMAKHDDVIYIATAVGFDDEMRDRIARHRAQRNPQWTTVECFRDFKNILPGMCADKGYMLLDCVTVMITNLMVADSGIDWDAAGMGLVEAVEKNIRAELTDIIQMAREFHGETVIVSNELGMGLVPPTPLGRHYRDIAGKMNQYIAAEADKVYFMVSGIPVVVKG